MKVNKDVVINTLCIIPGVQQVIGGANILYGLFKGIGDGLQQLGRKIFTKTPVDLTNFKKDMQTFGLGIMRVIPLVGSIGSGILLGKACKAKDPTPVIFEEKVIEEVIEPEVTVLDLEVTETKYPLSELAVLQGKKASSSTTYLDEEEIKELNEDYDLNLEEEGGYRWRKYAKDDEQIIVLVDNELNPILSDGSVITKK